MYRFRTIKIKTICSDPDNSWAKKAMKIVDSRNQLTKESSKEPFVYDTSTANVIPTTPTIQGITTEGKISDSTHSSWITFKLGFWHGLFWENNVALFLQPKTAA